MGFPDQVGLAAYEAVRVASLAARHQDHGAARAAFAGGGTQATLDAAIKTAEIAHYRRLATGALANGISTDGPFNALRSLGTGGT